jgi:hypothetical protein
MTGYRVQARCGAAVAALIVLACLGATGALAADPTSGVRVLDTSGDRPKPCPDIVMHTRSDPEGGCVIHAVEGDVSLSVSTALGAFLFGKCSSYYTLHIDGRGRTVTESFGVLGDQPCPDVSSCFKGDRRPGDFKYPWKGRIKIGSDGAIRHESDACLDTCLGRFEGRTVVSLEERGGRWRAIASESTVGLSGWQIDGQWQWRRQRPDPLAHDNASGPDLRQTGLAIRRASP